MNRTGTKCNSSVLALHAFFFFLHDLIPLLQFQLDDWVLCRIYKKSNHSLSMDREQEDIAMDDLFMPSLTNTTLQNNPPKLPKSCSLTELLENVDFSSLSQLLENTPDIPCFQQDPAAHPSSNQPFISNNSSSNGSTFFVQQLSQTESPVLPAENRLKRELNIDSCLEDGGELSRPPKRLINSSIFTNLASQFDSPQYNLLGHPFFNQQLLLNSNFNFRRLNKGFQNIRWKENEEHESFND